MPMVDLLAEDQTPLQAPTLSKLEEAARAGVQNARKVALESLMALEDAPDVEALLAELVNRPAWQGQAACRGADPDLFSPERGSKRFREALAVCEVCSVRSRRLAVALDEPSTKAVRGGPSERCRRMLQRGVA